MSIFRRRGSGNTASSPLLSPPPTALPAEPEVFPPLSLLIVDDALRRFAGRDLVAGSEVVDFLLELRGTLARERPRQDLGSSEVRVHSPTSR